MKIWNQYLLPNTIDKAMRILREKDGQARLIAGGTDLLLDIQQGRHPAVDTLVDITRIPELQQIRLEGEEIHLGGAVTHRMILESDILREHANCLQQACAGIGGSQVRNVATIGGNVAHALPAGDGSIALLALNAQAKIICTVGERWENLEDLFQGPGKATFDPRRELLADFSFPISKLGDRSGFHRVMRPQGVAIAILNMAIWLHQRDSEKISDVRIAVGPAGPVPVRARKTEEFLRDREVNESVIKQATDILQKESKLRTSKHRATKEYRKHLLGYLMRKIMNDNFGTGD